MMATREGWIMITNDQCVVRTRVREACLDDVKSITMKEKENTCL